MLRLEVLWSCGLFVVIFLMQTHGSEFGVCEKTFLRRMLNTTVSPPEYYTFNVTVRECCYGFANISSHCIPMCQNVCINSHCIGANKCKCNPGYYAVDNFRCLPQCEPACGSNMACLAPNKCFCKPFYKRLDETHCEPVCSFTDDNFECINANCVAPNECECFEGYKNVSSFQCDPVCSDCLNGICLSPEVCECLDGYEKSSDGICMPVCDPTCKNAACIAPNTCKCHENFEKYLKSHECLEKQTIKDHKSCMSSCEFGSCTDDGSCECSAGYEMFNGKCSRVCDKECDNGRCLEDQCICPDDYKLSENGTSCLPICAFEDGHDCIEGTCVAPQTCECHEGYRFLDSRNCTCVPMCIPQCINGICTNDGCQCHANFYKNSESECIKNCSQGFVWAYDECIENIPLDLEISEEEENGKMATTDSSLTTYEDDDEEDVTDQFEEEEEGEDEDEGSSETANDSTTLIPIHQSSNDDNVVLKPILPRMFPLNYCIAIISTVILLILIILITFYCLHQMNPKNIYHVEQQEKSANCVYFTSQHHSDDANEECTL